MSANVNLVGMTPGGGGSFPMAGSRPKIRRAVTYTTSGQWIAPPNCYFIELTMCGGGGGASGGTLISSSNTYASTPSAGPSLVGPAIVRAVTGRPGASAACLLPTIVPVTPGQQYNIVVGQGGAGGGATVGQTTAPNLTGFLGLAGGDGGNSSFVGDIISVTTLGGAGGSSTSGATAVVTNSGSIPTAGGVIISQSSWGFTQVPGTSPATSFVSASVNFVSFLWNYNDGVSYFGDALYYQSTLGLSQYGAVTTTQTGISSSSAPRVEYNTTGSFVTASVGNVVHTTHGGAPSLFASGAAATSIAGGRPATPGFGAGGAANAFLLLRSGSGGTPGDLFQGIPTNVSQSVGFGGNGGSGMVRIIWEE